MVIIPYDMVEVEDKMDKYRESIDYDASKEKDMYNTYFEQSRKPSVRLDDTEEKNKLISEMPLHNYYFDYKTELAPGGRREMVQSEVLGEEANRKTALNNLLKAYPQLEKLSPENMGSLFGRYMNGENITDLIKEYGVITGEHISSISRLVVPTFMQKEYPKIKYPTITKTKPAGYYWE